MSYQPIGVTARLLGQVSMPDRPLALDALLAYAVVLRDHITPAATPEQVVPIEIPVEREPGGRFHLASHAVFTAEQRETRYQVKRSVIGEAQAMAPSLRRMQISAVHSKGYRIPFEAMHVRGDELRWWAIGDAAAVLALLDLVTHLGKKRASGLGRVREWLVEPCEPWGTGFPVVDPAGRPLRPLPLDWPGLADGCAVERCTITYPYPRTLNRDLHVCAVPWGSP